MDNKEQVVSLGSSQDYTTLGSDRSAGWFRCWWGIVLSRGDTTNLRIFFFCSAPSSVLWPVIKLMCAGEAERERVLLVTGVTNLLGPPTRSLLRRAKQCFPLPAPSPHPPRRTHDILNTRLERAPLPLPKIKSNYLAETMSSYLDLGLWHRAPKKHCFGLFFSPFFSGNICLVYYLANI